MFAPPTSLVSVLDKMETSFVVVDVVVVVAAAAAGRFD